MTLVIFEIPRPKKRGIKVIPVSFDFAAVECQTIKLKTSKISVNFWVAAPCPWREIQNSNHRVRGTGHTSKYSRQQKFSGGYSYCELLPPFFALTFCQNFVKKFPFPSPSPGAHHVRNLSRPPQALPTKKVWAPPAPTRGRYGGSNFQLPPLPPQIPFVRYRKSSVHGPSSSPATNPEILVNLRATQPQIFSLSYWPPAPEDI